MKVPFSNTFSWKKFASDIFKCVFFFFFLQVWLKLFSLCLWVKLILSHCSTLQWRHNEGDGISNHWHLYCLLNCWFRWNSKKTWKLCVTSLCVRNSTVTCEFPAQSASNAENVSIWWHRHEVALGQSDNKSVSVQVMAWHWTGQKPLPEPMITQIYDAKWSTPIDNQLGTDWWIWHIPCHQITIHWNNFFDLTWYQLSRKHI